MPRILKERVRVSDSSRSHSLPAMAATTPSDGGGGSRARGESWACGGGELSAGLGGGNTSGMSSAGLDSPPSLHSPSALTPEARSSGAFARAPSKGSYGYASPFGGVE